MGLAPQSQAKVGANDLAAHLMSAFSAAGALIAASAGR